MIRKNIKAQNKKRKGFTLVELIVVIAILAILSVGAIAGYSNVRASANDAVARANAGVIVRSLNTYQVVANAPYTTTGPTLVLASAKSTLDGILEITRTEGVVAIDLRIDATDAEIMAAWAMITYTPGATGVAGKFSVTG